MNKPIEIVTFQQTKKRILFILMAFALNFTNCGRRYEFEPDLNPETEIVISGLIHNGPGPYFITLERVKRNANDITEVQFARVKIIDDEGNEEDCVEVSPGIYECEGLIVKGQPGRSYHTEVVLDNNKSYSSLPDQMPTVKGNDMEVTWKETVKITTTPTGADVSTEIIQFSLLSNLPESNEPYQLFWRGEELYQFLQKQVFFAFQPPPPCYMLGDLSGKLKLFNSREHVSSTFSIENFSQREIDDTFLRKHVFSIHQLSISEAYFTYLETIGELTENVGSIFDTPKGLIQGNVVSLDNQNENVFGFFRAVQADTVHLAIFPRDLEAKPRDRCEIIRPGPNCFGCPKGTFDRPGLYTKIN